MAIEVNLRDIQSGFLSAAAIDMNNTLIEQAFVKALNREGGDNNAMEADLDLGLNNILNVDNLSVNKIDIDGTNYETVLQSIADDAQQSADSASVSENNAALSENLAESWANADEDVVVKDGRYSAKHFAIKAETAFDSLEPQFQADQSRREIEFQAAQDDREGVFNAYLVSAGYTGTAGNGDVEDYAAGIEITQYNQVVRDTSGEFWRLSGSTTLPYTTTGAGLPEGGAFVAVGDGVLRQELGQGVRRVSNLQALKSISGRFSGDVAYMVGRTTAGDGGEGRFRWDGSDMSSTLVLSTVTSTSVNATTNTITSAGHGLTTGSAVITTTAVNGLTANQVYWVVGVTTDTFQLSETLYGTAVDLTGKINFTVKHLLDPLQGVYVTSPSDTVGAGGCWIRESRKTVRVGQFGGSVDGITDDSLAFYCAAFIAPIDLTGETVLLSSLTRNTRFGRGLSIFSRGERGTLDGGGVSSLTPGYDTSLVAENIIFKNFEQALYATGWGVDSNKIDSVKVIGCDFLNMTQSSINFSTRVLRATVKDNYIDGLNGGIIDGDTYGIRIGISSDSDIDLRLEQSGYIVTGNTIRNVIGAGPQPLTKGILVYGTDHSIENNSLENIYNLDDSPVQGIYLRATKSRVVGNTLKNCGSGNVSSIMLKGFGEEAVASQNFIEVDDSHPYTTNAIESFVDRVHILSNTIRNKAGAGIMIRSNSIPVSCKITGNHFEDCKGHPTLARKPWINFIGDSSYNTEISNNTFELTNSYDTIASPSHCFVKVTTIDIENLSIRGNTVRANTAVDNSDSIFFIGGGGLGNDINGLMFSENTITINGAGEGYYVLIGTQGTADNVLISGNNLFGANATIPISYSPATRGNNALLSKNVGSLSENSGMVTIPSGRTSYAFSHGLLINSATLSNVSVYLTPAGNIAGASKMWVSSVTSSSMTVSFNTEITSDLDVYWYIDASRTLQPV